MGEIRFVGTGETRGYPYLVCKKYMSPFSHVTTLKVNRFSFKASKFVLFMFWIASQWGLALKTQDFLNGNCL